ncbi:MAG: hydrogenase maturation protease [archaeon]
MTDHLKNSMKLILGIGNELKQDDSLGVRVARELKEELGDRKDLKIIECGLAPISLLGKMPVEPEELYIVDAVKIPGLNPGETIFKQVNKLKESEKPISTHRLPISMIKTKLNPSKTYLAGVVPIKISYGEEMSPEILKAKEEIKEKIIQKLKN